MVHRKVSISSPGKPDLPPLRVPDRVRVDSSNRRGTYREFPTPHPLKFADEGSYFGDGDKEDRSSPTEQPTISTVYPSGLRVREDETDQSGPVRPGFPTWSSSFESIALPIERTLSAEEEGATKPRKPSGIVGSLIKYGIAKAKGTVDEDCRSLARTNSLASATSENQEAYESRQPSYREKCLNRRHRRTLEIIRNVESYSVRQKFILKLAKALLSFGAPSHRIESQLHSASEVLKVNAAFVHFPNLILVSFLDSDTRTSETHFVRAGGRIALTSLYEVHGVYRRVLRDEITASAGTEQLRQILRARPLYNIYSRCVYAFICASIICGLSFGGSFIDMFISGAAASLLQYLGLNAAARSSIYANVYEISVSIVVSFIARVLGTLKGDIFCYSAISSAGVVLILPGFTILISALELTSRNILCGSVRMVYAIIYTLFLGFGLTLGSDFYLMVDPTARRHLGDDNSLDTQFLHGYLLGNNASLPVSSLSGTWAFSDIPNKGSEIVKGCYRDSSWPWYRQAFPWWTVFFLVPLYSLFSSLANLQSLRSLQLLWMVSFSCAAYAANRGATYLISGRSDIVSAFGALIIGLCGNLYSRLLGGSAFTSMVTGVLFLVPSAIGNGGGLVEDYNTSSTQYSDTFDLGVRMIEVAIGVTVGLFVSQIMVYTLGRRKGAAHFAF